MNSINPTAGFSADDVIKKFHWLINNGLTVEKAAQTIKEETTIQSVIKYVDNYLNNRKGKR